MDATDEQIVWLLVEDGRASVTAIADRLGVSKSTVTNRIARLRESGVLRGVHADPDFRALGLPIHALVFIRLRVHGRAQVSDYAAMLIRVPTVVSAFHLTGGDDFIAHLSCSSPDHLREVVETSIASHPAVATTRTQLVYDWARGDVNMGHLTGWGDVRENRKPYASAFEG